MRSERIIRMVTVIAACTAATGAVVVAPVVAHASAGAAPAAWTAAHVQPLRHTHSPTPSPTPSASASTSPATAPQVELTIPLAGGGAAEFGFTYVSPSSGPFLWYSYQTSATGPFSAWSEVLSEPLNNEYPVISAAQDADSGLEVFTMESETDTIVRVYQTTLGGTWAAPANFGPGGAGIPLYFGYPYLFTMANGSLAYFAVYEESAGPELFVIEEGPTGTWGAWTNLGAGPEPESVGVPTSVTESSTGALTAIAHLWNASTGYYCEITQLGAYGAWGPWVECANDGCVS
jgi:hypothetical protein